MTMNEDLIERKDYTHDLMRGLMREKRRNSIFRKKENEAKRKHRKRQTTGDCRKINKEVHGKEKRQQQGDSSQSSMFTIHRIIRESEINGEVQMEFEQNCNSTITELIQQFQNKIKLGPEHVCTCCDQLWNRSSVIKCHEDLYKVCPKTLLDSCITGVKSADDSEWICSTCYSNLREEKMPSCTIANKMIPPRNQLF